MTRAKLSPTRRDSKRRKSPIRLRRWIQIHLQYVYWVDNKQFIGPLHFEMRKTSNSPFFLYPAYILQTYCFRLECRTYINNKISCGKWISRAKELGEKWILMERNKTTTRKTYRRRIYQRHVNPGWLFFLTIFFPRAVKNSPTSGRSAFSELDSIYFARAAWRRRCSHAILDNARNNLGVSH